MPFTGRSLAKELDFTGAELLEIVGLAHDLKAERKEGREQQRLRGKGIVLIFEKTSTRTRCAFEVAAAQQGAMTTYLPPDGSQMGRKESVADTARVLGRMYDAIEYRGFAQSTVETLVQYSGVPVYNGLTDDFHPTQMLADLLTMTEHAPDKRINEVALCYLGDARNNMGNSTLVTGALVGMDVRLAAPRSLWPADALIDQARLIAETTGARITVTEDVDEGVRGVDFVSTDVWVSMGEPESVWRERIDLLRPYRIDAALIARSDNAGTKLLHCLPAYHDDSTEVGRLVAELSGLDDGIEVSDEVFEGPASVVWDQAENRMHSIKAVLVATLT